MSIQKYKMRPSSMERNLHCTMSLEFPESFAPNKYSAMGSLQHDVAATILEIKYHKASLEEKLNTLKNTPYINQGVEVRWDKTCDPIVNEYISYVHNIISKYDVNTITIEDNTKTIFYNKVITGIVDVALISDTTKKIIIVDLKSGRTRVETEDNTQMLIYALGVYQNYIKKDVKYKDYNIIISICQPAINNISAYEYTKEEIAKWYISKKEVIDEINSNKLTYRPRTDICKYCSNRDNCNERIKKGIL